MNRKELLRRISRDNTHNVKFNEFQHLIEGFGFSLRRIAGSQHIFTRAGIRGYLNLQPKRGEVSDYQVSQFLKLIEKYNLKLEE